VACSSQSSSGMHSLGLILTERLGLNRVPDCPTCMAPFIIQVSCNAGESLRHGGLPAAPSQGTDRRPQLTASSTGGGPLINRSAVVRLGPVLRLPPPQHPHHLLGASSRPLQVVTETGLALVLLGERPAPAFTRAIKHNNDRSMRRLLFIRLTFGRRVFPLPVFHADRPVRDMPASVIGDGAFALGRQLETLAFLAASMRRCSGRSSLL
jgi:hypothetical protein